MKASPIVSTFHSWASSSTKASIATKSEWSRLMTSMGAQAWDMAVKPTMSVKRMVMPSCILATVCPRKGKVLDEPLLTSCLRERASSF